MNNMEVYKNTTNLNKNTNFKKENVVNSQVIGEITNEK